MLAETAVDDFIAMLQANLPDTLEIKDYVIAEQSLAQIPNYPIIFVLCPTFDIIGWQTDGYADVLYNMVIGCMVLHQDTTMLKRTLYQIIEQVIIALIKSQSSQGFNYTMLQRGSFRANFSPIFAAGESFMADAQISVPVKRNSVEMLEVI